jgi:methionyl-tRNA formyltransferase
MRIFIITMDDPIYIIPFIKEIIIKRQRDIIGLAVTKGDRLTIGQKRSKLTYLLSLLLIMGLQMFLISSFKILTFKINNVLSKYFTIIVSPSILSFALSKNIPAWKIKSPNDAEFIKRLSDLKPEIIINQSQCILKKELLQIPVIGVLNRHNSLLPSNRGRLSPFWVLYKKEKETGVSIHFVDEGIDTGDIIVQKKITVQENESFSSLVKRNYELAIMAMLEALDELDTGNPNIIQKDNIKASYNTIPSLKEAFDYRIARSIRFRNRTR